jgi:hypothetical protein
MKYTPCPRCGSHKVLRERRVNGYTECRTCFLKLPSLAWDELKRKRKSLKGGEAIQLQAPKISEDEIRIINSRRDELWTRLARVLPDDSGFYSSGEIDLSCKKDEVKIIIMNYIAELEYRREIPYGLTVKKVSMNKKKEGHLLVEFGFADDCPFMNKSQLIPFIAGSYSLL